MFQASTNSWQLSCLNHNGLVILGCYANSEHWPCPAHVLWTTMSWRYSNSQQTFLEATREQTCIVWIPHCRGNSFNGPNSSKAFPVCSPSYGCCQPLITIPWFVFDMSMFSHMSQVQKGCLVVGYGVRSHVSWRPTSSSQCCKKTRLAAVSASN